MLDATKAISRWRSRRYHATDASQRSLFPDRALRLLLPGAVSSTPLTRPR